MNQSWGIFCDERHKKKKKNIESIVGSKCSVPLKCHDYI